MLFLTPNSSHPHDPAVQSVLLCLFMRRMLLAELAILIELDPVRIVLLVLVRPIIAIFADRAGQRDRITVRTCHPYALLTHLVNRPLLKRANIIYHN